MSICVLVTQLCPTLCSPPTVACQAPLSRGFSRQEHWNGLPFPSPGDLPNPGIEPRSPHSRQIHYHLSQCPTLCDPLDCSPPGSLVHGDSPGKNIENFFQKIEMLLIPGGTVVKNLPASGGEASSIPGSGRSPGEGNGNPLHYSCLGNHMDRGVWQATVQGVAKGWTRN